MLKAPAAVIAYGCMTAERGGMLHLYYEYVLFLQDYDNSNSFDFPPFSLVYSKIIVHIVYIVKLFRQVRGRKKIFWQKNGKIKSGVTPFDLLELCSCLYYTDYNLLDGNF